MTRQGEYLYWHVGFELDGPQLYLVAGVKQGKTPPAAVPSRFSVQAAAVFMRCVVV